MKMDTTGSKVNAVNGSTEAEVKFAPFPKAQMRVMNPEHVCEDGDYPREKQVESDAAFEQLVVSIPAKWISRPENCREIREAITNVKNSVRELARNMCVYVGSTHGYLKISGNNDPVLAQVGESLADSVSKIMETILEEGPSSERSAALVVDSSLTTALVNHLDYTVQVTGRLPGDSYVRALWATNHGTVVGHVDEIRGCMRDLWVVVDKVFDESRRRTELIDLCIGWIRSLWATWSQPIAQYDQQEPEAWLVADAQAREAAYTELRDQGLCQYEASVTMADRFAEPYLR